MVVKKKKFERKRKKMNMEKKGENNILNLLEICS